MKLEVPEREPEISLLLLKKFVSDLVNLYWLTICRLARKFEVLKAPIECLVIFGQTLMMFEKREVTQLPI